MRKLFIPLIVLSIVVFAACSKKANPSNAEPAKPKVVATTYSASVLPLIQAKCTPCHIPASGGRKADFSNYAAAMKFGADMVVRIEKAPTDRGFMPFKNAKLSNEDIAVFKKWVSDGMLEK